MDGAARKWFTEIRTREPRGPSTARHDTPGAYKTEYFFYGDLSSMPVRVRGATFSRPTGPLKRRLESSHGDS